MTTETPDSGSEALSVEDAVSLIQGPAPEQDDAPAPVEAAQEPEEIEGEASAPEAADEAEEAVEGEEPQEEAEAVEPVEPPAYWSKEAKAKFADLPPELQAVVLAQEGPREAAAAKAKAEAKAEAEQAQAKVKAVDQLADQLNAFLPQAVQAFQSKWDNVDWAAYAEQDPEACFKDKLRFEQEQAHLVQLSQAQQQAEQIKHAEYVKAEFAKLSEVAPELADPVEGPKRREEVGKFLVSAGLPPEALGNISATELSIAYDAYRYRQAKLAVAAKPKAPAPPARPPVKAAAAAPVRTSQQRSVEQLRGKLARSNDPVADAVALLQAMRAK